MHAGIFNVLFWETDHGAYDVVVQLVDSVVANPRSHPFVGILCILHQRTDVQIEQQIVVRTVLMIYIQFIFLMTLSRLTPIVRIIRVSLNGEVLA